MATSLPKNISIADPNPGIPPSVTHHDGPWPASSSSATHRNDGGSNDDAITKLDTPAAAGGIYFGRGRLPAVAHAASRRITFERSVSRSPKTDDVEQAEFGIAAHDGEDGVNNTSEGNTKQVFKGKTLIWLAYQSIGVIYGDIGTSPLYVYSSTFTAPPTKRHLMQVLSLIIWSITLMVTIKYVFIILHADNHGEGGTFSCYSLLTRFANITQRDPREAATIKMQRYRSSDVHTTTRNIRSGLENSRFARNLLKTIGALAVSMVVADGVLTPAQSVLGAVQGLTVVKPDITSSTIVGTACGILVLLFLIQPLGTTKLATSFAPIVILWLGLNGAFGIYNLVKFDASVLKAFSPAFAINLFVEHKTEGWKMLGGILLAFTGVEALYADLGAFSMRAIQISWLTWAYPCLLLAYIGQAAHIAVRPDAYVNPFFHTVPPGMLYPSLVIAVLAAIVASQAMITATFQLASQVMKLSFCPQMKVVHTSRRFHGQIYVPALNWTLMAGSILVTAVFNNTTRLGAAYGVCVIFVTFFDTCLVTLVALIVWKLPIWIVFVPWLFYATFDGLYLSSALIKVPHGAWLTILASGILASLFLIWRFGKEKQWKAELEDRIPPSALITRNPDGDLILIPKWGGDTLQRLPGFAVFFDKTGILTPSVFSQFTSKLGMLPDVSVFFHLHHVETPSVPDGERYSISRFTALPGCYRIVIRRGYMDEIVSSDLAALMYEQIRQYVMTSSSLLPRIPNVEAENIVNKEESQSVRDTRIAGELDRLDNAFAHRILYVVGKGQMLISDKVPIWRRLVLSTYLWVRENTRAKIANLRLGMDRVVEVGFIKMIE